MSARWVGVSGFWHPLGGITRRHALRGQGFPKTQASEGWPRLIGGPGSAGLRPPSPDDNTSAQAPWMLTGPEVQHKKKTKEQGSGLEETYTSRRH